MYTKITEVNLSAFIYRLFHEDFSSLIRTKYICEQQQWPFLVLITKLSGIVLYLYKLFNRFHIVTLFKEIYTIHFPTLWVWI